MLQSFVFCLSCKHRGSDSAGTSQLKILIVSANLAEVQAMEDLHTIGVGGGYPPVSTGNRSSRFHEDSMKAGLVAMPSYGTPQLSSDPLIPMQTAARTRWQPQRLTSNPPLIAVGAVADEGKQKCPRSSNSLRSMPARRRVAGSDLGGWGLSGARNRPGCSPHGFHTNAP